MAFSNIFNKKTYYLAALVVVILAAGYVVNSMVNNYLADKKELQLIQQYGQNPDYKVFIDMLEVDKNDLATPGITEGKRAAATMDMGLQWFNLREYELAARWWKRGLDIEPKNSIGWYNLGNAYTALKKYSKAEKAYRESIEYAGPADFDGCFGLGDLYKYSYTSKSEKQEGVYLKCLEKHENHRDLLARLAGYYRDIGNREKALIYFDKLWSVDPTPELSNEIRSLQISIQEEEKSKE